MLTMKTTALTSFAALSCQMTVVPNLMVVAEYTIVPCPNQQRYPLLLYCGIVRYVWLHCGEYCGCDLNFVFVLGR